MVSGGGVLVVCSGMMSKGRDGIALLAKKRVRRTAEKFVSSLSQELQVLGHIRWRVELVMG